MRRFASHMTLPGLTVAARCYTAPAEAAKVYNSDFTAGPFPIDFVSSETVAYAQFLFKLAEPSKAFAQYQKDFDTLKSLKLPVFWERSTDVTSFQEVTSKVSANFVFFLRWIQVSGNLENIEKVRGYYDMLVNAQQKKLIATVYTSAAGAQDTAVQNAAKSQVAETVKTSAFLKDKASWTVETKFAVDPTVPGKGWYAEVAGVSISTIEQKRGDEAAVGATGDVDYQNVAAQRQVMKTVWDDNIETDVLRKYLDSLALFDEEEQKIGV